MTAAPRALSRRNFDTQGSVPVARIVHFGLGSFHRAHQAWFTARSRDAEQWGICAFTGRSEGLHHSLLQQDGLYTLVERSAVSDTFEVLTNMVEFYLGSNSTAIMDVLSRQEIVVITTTVTEAGYRFNLDGTPQLGDVELESDVATLRGLTQVDHLGEPVVTTVPGRILLGLEARRRANAGPLTIVPCDNLPRNGWVLERGFHQLALLISEPLNKWISDNVSFATSCVDRITPRTTPGDIDTVVRETGWIDAAPVVTEPFASWVVSGEFRAGRPQWESAGVQFVTDVEPYERRKLWLLNGAHTVLALFGLAAGHRTVAQAINDPHCQHHVESFWRSARRHLPESLDLDEYCAQLIARFQNARIMYELDQIVSDCTMKLRTRVIPVVVAELRAGRTCDEGAEVLAAWIRRLQVVGPLMDAEAPAVAAILESSTATADLIELIDPELSEFAGFVDRVHQLVAKQTAHLDTAAPITSTTGED